MLRLLAFIPLVAIIVVLVGVSALTGRSDVLVIAAPAATPVIVMTVLGWHMARRASERGR
ncbi:MAG TPA: hypothetical protein VGR11_06275 [Solirubrobacteraceae bacterium]|nr:hypothetical protein [Solirubrobacteraceae bacterium]